MTVDRRHFIKTASAASAATALSYSRILGANDRVRLGLIGCGSRGIGVMNTFLKLTAGAGAVCDVYAAQVNLARRTANDAKAFKDHRRLLENKDLDAVIVAVPDH